jgi:hypothetical protein
MAVERMIGQVVSKAKQNQTYDNSHRFFAEFYGKAPEKNIFV